MMPTVTCYETPHTPTGAPNRVYLRERHTGYLSTWAAARLGQEDLNPQDTSPQPIFIASVGRTTSPTYGASFSFFEFDTSAVPTGALVTDVRLTLSASRGTSGGTNETWITPRIYAYDWGGDPVSHIPAASSLLDSAWVGSFPYSNLVVTNNPELQNRSTVEVTNRGNILSSINNAGQGVTRYLVTLSGYVTQSSNPTDSRTGSVRILTQYSQHTNLWPNLEITYEAGFDHLDTSSSGLVVAGSGSGHYLERSGAGLIRRAGTEGAGSLILDGSHMKVKS